MKQLCKRKCMIAQIIWMQQQCFLLHVFCIWTCKKVVSCAVLLSKAMLQWRNWSSVSCLFPWVYNFGLTANESFLHLVSSLPPPQCSTPLSVAPQRQQTHRQCFNACSMIMGKIDKYNLKLIYISMRNRHVLPFSIKIMYLRMNKDKNPKWPQVKHCCNWHNKNTFFQFL